MSASVGMLGGARAQYHLRQIFVYLNMYPINGPEVIVTFAQDKFDANGNLVDENTQMFVRQLLQNLVNQTENKSVVFKIFKLVINILIIAVFAIYNLKMKSF